MVEVVSLDVVRDSTFPVRFIDLYVITHCLSITGRERAVKVSRLRRNETKDNRPTTGHRRFLCRLFQRCIYAAESISTASVITTTNLEPPTVDPRFCPNHVFIVPKNLNMCLGMDGRPHATERGSRVKGSWPPRRRHASGEPPMVGNRIVASDLRHLAWADLMFLLHERTFKVVVRVSISSIGDFNA